MWSSDPSGFQVFSVKELLLNNDSNAGTPDMQANDILSITDPVELPRLY